MMDLSGPVRGVQRTAELMRIVGIPRRVWSPEEGERFARDLSNAIRRPGRAGLLRPVQAIFLYEIFRKDGGIGSIRTGGGKTLISLLAPYVRKAHRPLLLLPAKLVEKTRREQRILMQTWPIPTNIQILSYEMLGRVQAAEKLDTYKPDLIVADECHKLKNKDAGVTIRVMRYLRDNPDVAFVGMSGTITKRSVKDYAHLVAKALPHPNSCPVPLRKEDIETFADALDEGGSLNPGALLTYLCVPADMYDENKVHRSPRTMARHGFRRRLAETEGIIATTEAFTGASLTISNITAEMNKAVEYAFYQLRVDGERPDGKVILEKPDFKRHARELGLGFYYRWDPPPPPDWMRLRKDWSKRCRDLLKNNQRKLDTPHQVVLAVQQGHYPQHSASLEAWLRIRPTFEPNTVPVWIDDTVINQCAKWLKDGPGIVWTEHVAFAERLSAVSSVPYFGRKGHCGALYIEDHPATLPLIASCASNAEGRNLQAWNRNLFVGMPQNAMQTEQVIARTHRDFQDADEVTVEIIMTCAEHVDDYDRVISEARYAEASTGNAQKILYADTIIKPPSYTSEHYYRWTKEDEG